MTNQLIECVPNFSEGNDTHIIESIAQEIRSVKGVSLLNIDPGKAANRTVYTFVGNPAAVSEAAFLAIKKAAELIDMRSQKGEHPRIGATDVCPFIPIRNISMKETSEYAKKLGKRVGDELNIPVYLYEESQENKKRSNLAVIRKGEYEGLSKKITLPEWKPDFGPTTGFEKWGASVIGARNFLIAYNINLDTSNVSLAKKIAEQVRESGKEVIDSDGNRVHFPGALKTVKAIGWYIKEYNKAQVSMNLTNIEITPLHLAFEKVCELAKKEGVIVTGSELIGLCPLEVLTEAGKYYLNEENKNTNTTEDELISVAVKKLGLDELVPFDPHKKIIEYLID